MSSYRIKSARCSWEARSHACSRRCKTRLRSIRAPGSWHPRCWQAGKRGQASTPGPSSGHPQRWKVATVICRRCSIITGACPRAAPRYGRCCITSMVAPAIGRRQPHGCSGGSFLISLSASYRRSMRCPCPGNTIRLSQYVIEVTSCPGLHGYPPSAPHRDSNGHQSTTLCRLVVGGATLENVQVAFRPMSTNGVIRQQQ